MPGEQKHRMSTADRSFRGGALSSAFALLVLLFALAPTVAKASECTDVWVGPTEGSWGTAANWSAGTVPTEGDVVCIGSGDTVIAEGEHDVGVIRGAGSVRISGTLKVVGSE